MDSLAFAQVEARRFGRFDRLFRRFSPRSLCPSATKALSSPSRAGIIVTGLLARSILCPADFYHIGVRGCGIPQGTESRGSLLFERLVDRRRQPSVPPSAPGLFDPSGAAPGLSIKLGEVGYYADSGSSVFGSGDRLYPVFGRVRTQRGSERSWRRQGPFGTGTLPRPGPGFSS